MKWTQAAPDFEWDGATRDIYVLGASVEDWQRVLDMLRHRRLPLAFVIDGEAVVLPERAEEILASNSLKFLRLEVDGLNLSCHFFDDAEIEFHIDPRDVSDQSRLNTLADFMALLAGSTGKTAILTHENMREAVILQCQPGGRAIWIAPPSH